MLELWNNVKKKVLEQWKMEWNGMMIDDLFLRNPLFQYSILPLFLFYFFWE